MGEDHTTRCRMKDGAVSASYLMEPTEGGLLRLLLSVVPGLGAGPPRILFVKLDGESGRSVLLPWGATKGPPVEWLAHSMRIEEEEAQILCRFLDGELRSLVSPSTDPRDLSTEAEYDPITETEEVPKKNG